MKLNDGLPNLLNTESCFTELSFDQLFLYYEMKGIKLNRKTFKTNLGTDYMDLVDEIERKLQ